jgi:hypothetical protein
LCNEAYNEAYNETREDAAKEWDARGYKRERRNKDFDDVR